LRAHKKATRSWDYKWLKAYAKGDAVTTLKSDDSQKPVENKDLELEKPVENKDLEAIVGGIEEVEGALESPELPIVSPRIMRFNEWVLLNQVTTNV